jgi:hypothetical protein
MTQQSAKKANTSLRRVLPLLVLLVVVAFFALRFARHGLPLQFSRALLHGSQKQYVSNQVARKYEDATVDSIQKLMGGFWVWAVDSPVQVRDRLELRDNGIIWNQLQYRYPLPDGTTRTRHHMIHAYIEPYGMKQGDSATSVCNAILIRQIWFSEDDTCFGSSNDTLMWQISRNESTLTFENRTYRPYTGSLDTFFVSGAVDLVDSVGIDNCPRPAHIRRFMREDIVTATDRVPAMPHTPSRIRTYIDRYYLPITVINVVNGMARIDPARPRGLQARFVVTAEGRIEQVRLTGADTWHESRKTALQRRMGTWLLPAAAGSGAPVSLTYDF